MTQNSFQTLLCYEQMAPNIKGHSRQDIHPGPTLHTPLWGQVVWCLFSVYAQTYPVPAMSCTLWRGYHATAIILKTWLKKCSTQRKWEK